MKGFLTQALYRSSFTRLTRSEEAGLSWVDLSRITVMLSLNGLVNVELAFSSLISCQAPSLYITTPTTRLSAEAWHLSA